MGALDGVGGGGAQWRNVARRIYEKEMSHVSVAKKSLCPVSNL